MSGTIYKFQLTKSARQLVELPKNAEILKLDVRDTELFIWAFVESGPEENIKHEIFIFKTGHPINDRHKLKYLNTVFDGYFVWHVFMKDKP